MKEIQDIVKDSGREIDVCQRLSGQSMIEIQTKELPCCFKPSAAEQIIPDLFWHILQKNLASDQKHKRCLDNCPANVAAGS